MKLILSTLAIFFLLIPSVVIADCSDYPATLLCDDFEFSVSRDEGTDCSIFFTSQLKSLTFPIF